MAEIALHTPGPEEIIRPQFSDIDLNFDGKKDLVIFNRDGGRFSVYINEGGFGEMSYRYSPELTANFDSCDCVEWALLVDYNCDGREDVFCGFSAGTKLSGL